MDPTTTQRTGSGGHSGDGMPPSAPWFLLAAQPGPVIPGALCRGALWVYSHYMTGRGFRQRRRNRHGRGLRGPLVPYPLPGNLTRSEQFDEWVLESAERLERLWGERMLHLQFVVQEIPDDLEAMTREELQGLLGSCTPAGGPDEPASLPTIVVYRRPVEMAARGVVPVNEMVHDVVVEQAAELLGMSPEAVDPAYGRSRE